MRRERPLLSRHDLSLHNNRPYQKAGNNALLWAAVDLTVYGLKRVISLAPLWEYCGNQFVNALRWKAFAIAALPASLGWI